MKPVTCEHNECHSFEIAEYTWLVAVDGKDTIWLCAKHAVEYGFCLWCQHFGAGSEDYDFSPLEGYHRDCYDELRYEVGEYDEDDEEWDDAWDFYPASWYDPDMDVPEDEDSPVTYIGPESEAVDEPAP